MQLSVPSDSGDILIKRIEKIDKKLDTIIGELDTIHIIEWLARACTVKDINYGMMALSC